MNSDMPEIEVTIEYDGFIAGRELTEIIEALDDALWYEIEGLVFPPIYRHRYYSHRFDTQPPPLICLSGVDKGSISLTCIFGGVAAKYCYDRFKKGFRRSRFGDEIEHFGEIIGKNLGNIIERMNRWLDEYTSDAKEKKSRIKNVRVRPKKRKEKED